MTLFSSSGVLQESLQDSRTLHQTGSIFKPYEDEKTRQLSEPLDLRLDLSKRTPPQAQLQTKPQEFQNSNLVSKSKICGPVFENRFLGLPEAGIKNSGDDRPQDHDHPIDYSMPRCKEENMPNEFGETGENIETEALNPENDYIPKKLRAIGKGS